MVGRVSNLHLSHKLLKNLQSNMNRQNELTDHIYSKTRILKPSDDPHLTSKALMMRSQQRRLDRYDNTVTHSKSWADSTRIQMDSAVKIWGRVSEITTEATNGTKTADALEGMAVELENLLGQLVQVSNGTHDGQYIFSGSQSNNPAFDVETDANSNNITGVYFQGDSLERSVKTRDQGNVAIGILGSNSGNPGQRGAFIDSAQGIDLFKTLMTLRDRLHNNDTIALSEPGGLKEQVDQGARNLIGTQSRVGGALAALELDRNIIAKQNAELEKNLSEMDGEQYFYQLQIELMTVTSVYQAALASSGRLQQQGLLNFI